MTPELSGWRCYPIITVGFEWFDGDIDKGEAMLKECLKQHPVSGPDSENLLTEVREAIDDDMDLPKA